MWVPYLKVLSLLLAFSSSGIEAGALGLAVLPAAPLQLQPLSFGLLLQPSLGEGARSPLQVLLFSLHSPAHLLYLLIGTIDGLLNAAFYR